MVTIHSSPRLRSQSLTVYARAKRFSIIFWALLREVESVEE